MNSKIPREWILSQDLLSRFPEGSDARPLARASGLLDDTELAITDLDTDLTGLSGKIRDGVYSAEQVTIAFAKRAAIAQQALSCLADYCLEAALKQARALDRHRAETGQCVGPLHGMFLS